MQQAAEAASVHGSGLLWSAPRLGLHMLCLAMQGQLPPRQHATALQQQTDENRKRECGQ